MNKTYQINGLLKFAELDLYNEGCQPGTAQSIMVDVDFHANTTAEVIKKAQQWLDVDDDGIEKNACDEPGRVDFQKMETADSETPSTRQMDAWKRGEIKLYAVTYIAHVEETRPATL